MWLGDGQGNHTNHGSKPNDAIMPQTIPLFTPKNQVGILGPMIISVLVGAFFSGLLTIQSATYFRYFPNDNRWLKLLVGSTILLSIIHVASWTCLAWQWLVAGYGEWAGLFDASWTFASEPIISQLTVSFAQAFFVYRGFILTRRNKVLLLFLVCGILASLALFIAYSILLVGNSSNAISLRFTLIIALSFTIATDVVITGVTTWKLLTSRKGINPSTDNGLAKLLQVTWEAALPPSLAAVANLLVMLHMARPFVGPVSVMMFFSILMPRLYVFSLMYTLNSRSDVRRVFDSDHAKWPSSLPLSTDGSKQQTATTRIDFAPMLSIDTDRSDTPSTLNGDGIATDVQENNTYERDKLHGSASSLRIEISQKDISHYGSP